jgi:regulator of protease activity HflC (stomatin/prohibitin superfamily)
MLPFRKFIIHKNEIGFLFKNDDFFGVLEPASYSYFDPLVKIKVETYDLLKPEFEHRLIDFFIKTQAKFIAAYFKLVELTTKQVALVYNNGRLVDILPPNSRKLYWKRFLDIKVEIIDISEVFEIKNAEWLIYANMETLLGKIDKFIYSSEVPEHKIGLLTVGGKYIQTLSPGLYAYWKINHHINIEIWDTRLQNIDISGQEILTKDKVSLRINLSASYLINDVQLTISKLSNHFEHLYKELQFGLRAAVGIHSLDDLLENKNMIDELVFAYIQAKMANFGIEIKSIGVKDIILPGEMKIILSKVVEAEKLAEANLIKRREETAATRSLLNTAKVMENNPTALRLKELEVLEKVTEKIGNISVYGGLEGLLKELVKIKS